MAILNNQQKGQTTTEILFILPVLILFVIGFLTLSIRVVNRWSLTYLNQEREVCSHFLKANNKCRQRFQHKKDKLLWLQN